MSYVDPKKILREVRAELAHRPHNDDDQHHRHANPNDELVIATAADLEMCGVDWLWPGRFARGKFGLIAGLPDMGKGQIAAFIAAAATAALALPCDEGNAPQAT
jgi:putative DNA primase/helicase